MGADAAPSPPTALAAALQLAPEPDTPPAPDSAPDPMPQSLVEAVMLFDAHREALLRAHLWSHVHLVSFQPGRIEFRKEAGAPDNLANRVSQLLGEWTGRRWLVAYSDQPGQPTLAEEEARRQSALRNEVAGHPLVRAVIETFPGATIAAVRERAGMIDGAGDTTGEDADSGEDS